MTASRSSRERRREIASADPIRDHQRIVHLLACYEFPWDMTRALEFALFRTFCDPSVSGLLHRTGEFERRTQKRYDDTDLLVSELLEWGYDSPRGTAALARINAQHGGFKIANDDSLYVLSTFVFEPIRWINRFGWRRLREQERSALFRFWREVGIRMGIDDIPDDYSAFERFNVDRERRCFRFAESNRLVGEATLRMFASWFPSWTRGLIDAGMRAIMDDALIAGFGFRRPSKLTRWADRSAPSAVS